MKKSRENYAAALRKKNRHDAFMDKRKKFFESDDKDFPTKYEAFLNNIDPVLLDTKTGVVSI